MTRVALLLVLLAPATSIAQRAVTRDVGVVRVELEPVCSENRIVRLRLRRPPTSAGTTVVLMSLRVGGRAVPIPRLSAILGGRPIDLASAGYSWVAGTGDELAIHAPLPRSGRVEIVMMVDGTSVTLARAAELCLGGSGLPTD